MTINAILQARADAKCELCGAEHALTAFPVPHSPASDDDHSVALCTTCRGQLEQPDTTEVNHWRCLGDSMWSQVPAVQVMAWRQLKALSARGEIWAQDMLDMMYMEEETKAWAEAGAARDDTRAGQGPSAAQEALVVGGRAVREALTRGGELRPVDSEHSAIWQCLWGEAPESVEPYWATASFSSAISSALMETDSLRVFLS